MQTTRGAGNAREEWLSEAIAIANIPTLACVLVQFTGEMKWIREPYVPGKPRGLDDNDSGGLPDLRQAEIRAAALDAIVNRMHGAPVAIPEPSDDLLVEMMSVSLHEEIPERYAPMIRHELGMVPPTDEHVIRDPGLPETGEAGSGDAAPPEGFSALIIGAGISGLCAAINLRSAGIPFTIVERNRHLGGVWHENKYPGAACDVPSHLYSFSFAPFDWARYFASSDEIERYLEHVADEYDLRGHIRFGVEVTEARFDEVAAVWHASCTTGEGGAETLSADMVISAVGAFNKPKYPPVSGLDLFEGQSAHTARWPAGGLDLVGKRVVVVGNGASAMQVVPAIADEVASLTVIQRSTQWAAPFPKFLKDVPPAIQRLMNEVPLYRRWYRLRLSWAFNDKQYEALQKDPDWKDGAHSINAINDAQRRGLTKYIIDELGDAQELLSEVLPDYPPFGKRMLMDNGWFRTLARDHVELVTGSVAQVFKDGLRLSDGSDISADAIIWATGFDVVNFLAPMSLVGTGGVKLHDEWHGDDARAYLGTVVPGFPNFFCLYGPNTQFGHGGSLISIVERQVHYIMSLMRQMFVSGIRTLDVRRDVYEDYAEEIDRRHEGMIWTHRGMSTYYRNSKGRVVVCNPFRIIEFWEMTDAANLEDFRVLRTMQEHSADVAESEGNA